MSIINKILNLLYEQKKTQAELCNYIGIKPNVFTTWKIRGTDPPAKYLVQICDFFDVSLEYLLIDEEDDSETSKGKYNINMGSHNTYTAPIHNATGKKITINNKIDDSLISSTEYSSSESKYSTIMMYLESLDEKNKRHAIVDIEYMLENEYKINEEIIRKHSEDTGYQKFISYLASLDEKNCRHAVVDIEYLLESEYGVKKNDR